MSQLDERLLRELVDAVKGLLRKEQADRLRDVYLIGDIEKDIARTTIERLRELANEDEGKPINLYINSAGGNVTDGLAIHENLRLAIDLQENERRFSQGRGHLDGGAIPEDGLTVGQALSV